MMSGKPKNKPSKTQRIGGGLAGPGRKKGVPNKLTADVKSMILEALSNAGGAEYLTKQAALNPSAFMTLVGKVLPMTVAGDINEPLVIKVVRFAADDIEQQPAQPTIIDLTPSPAPTGRKPAQPINTTPLPSYIPSSQEEIAHEALRSAARALAQAQHDAQQTSNQN